MTNQINFTFQDSDWTTPTTFPDLKHAAELAIDLETELLTIIFTLWYVIFLFFFINFKDFPYLVERWDPVIAKWHLYFLEELNRLIVLNNKSYSDLLPVINKTLITIKIFIISYNFFHLNYI